jgi:uncharacterized protein (DUF488 family)
MTSSRLLTVGHSNHEIGSFVELLKGHLVTAIADVRSSPFSRYAPQFNRKTLTTELARHGISYAFLGRELGGRPEDTDCYEDGQIRYARLARTEPFHRGLQRLVDGSRREVIAVMCSEKDPLDCHRTLLVARELERVGFPVGHIHADGRMETHREAMDRLLAKFGLLQPDFFSSLEDLESEAIEKQERLVAYVRPAVAPLEGSTP